MDGKFLRNIRKSKHIRQGELAKLLGVTQAAVSKWERFGCNPETGTAVRIAEILGITVDELLKGELNESGQIKTDRTGLFIRVPVLGDIPAGIPIEAIENVEDWEDIPLANTTRGKRYFGLRVEGDSMEPEYRDGDVIIIEQQDRCNSGDDCAVMVNGMDATFKRVRLQENGLTLQPLNTKYEPRFFTADQVRTLPVKILGVVVEIRRRIHRK